MAELFILAMLGHFVGDFLLQTKHMALTKSKRGLNGTLTCVLHATIYTVSVCIFMGAAGSDGVWMYWLVLVPHFIIDRWSLAIQWLKLIRGRTFESAIANQDKHREFDVAFTSIVYTVVDNTLHALCLLAAIKYVYHV